MKRLEYSVLPDVHTATLVFLSFCFKQLPTLRALRAFSDSLMPSFPKAMCLS